jgi:hypothetical protein
MLSLVNDLEAAASAIAPVSQFGYVMDWPIGPNSLDRLNLSASQNAARSTLWRATTITFEVGAGEPSLTRQADVSARHDAASQPANRPNRPPGPPATTRGFGFNRAPPEIFLVRLWARGCICQQSNHRRIAKRPYQVQPREREAIGEGIFGVNISAVCVLVFVGLATVSVWTKFMHWQIMLKDHFAALVGLPAAVIASFMLVIFLRQTVGPINVKVAGLRIRWSRRLRDHVDIVLLVDGLRDTSGLGAGLGSVSILGRDASCNQRDRLVRCP